MGGGKGGSKRKVYDYLASVDYAVSHGPLDAINEIIIKDKSAVVGPVTESGVTSVKKKKLFGGDDGEGGIQGNIEFYLGTWDQAMSPELAARKGLAPSDAPGYRGIAHVFFRGESSILPGSTEEDGEISGNTFFSYIWNFILSVSSPISSGFGFKWTSNNPYMPAVGFRVSRSPVGLTESTIYPITGISESGEFIIAEEGDAFQDGKFDPRKAPDANPSAIIYEFLTNADWGRGHVPAAINIDSFNACAETLRNEHFGLSMKLTGQDEIENYIKEVLDHIKGALYQDPATGLWELKLIRNDYDVAGLPVLDVTNCDFYDIKTKSWGETVNQMTVTYTDPVSEKEASVTAQNLANIAIQGGVIAGTSNYYAIRNPWLGKKVAERDVIEASATLVSLKAQMNRRGFDLKPAGVVLVNWPDEGILNMPCRISNIDYGSSKDRKIQVELVEDVFGAADADGVAAVPDPPEPEVEPVPVEPEEAVLLTTPLPILTGLGISVAELDESYPRTSTMFLARDELGGVIDYDVVAPTIAGNGGEVESVVASFPPVRRATTSSALDQEVVSAIPASLFNNLTFDEPEVGTLFLLGDSDAQHEIVMLDSYDDQAQEWTVVRGLYDTLPRSWDAGTSIWRFFGTDDQIDPTERVAGEEVTYKLLPVLQSDQLEADDASGVAFTPSERPHAPFRPADAQVDGNGFDGPQYLSAPYPETIPITWANRNRTTEDSVATRWDDANVTPETGQTTTIRFRDRDSGTLELEETGLTGTNYDLDPSDLYLFRFYEVEFWAERDGIESIMAASRPLEIRRLGYGHNYGLDYGVY